MSAFVVTEETINTILTGIATERETTLIGYLLEKAGYDTKSEESMAILGRDLMNLNISAVDYRYNENSPKLDTFDFSPKRATIYSKLKNLQNFMYQCNEGEFCETELYKIMEQLEHVWMQSIIDKLPEFENAPWGH